MRSSELHSVNETVVEGYLCTSEMELVFGEGALCTKQSVSWNW